MIDIDNLSLQLCITSGDRFMDCKYHTIWLMMPKLDQSQLVEVEQFLLEYNAYVKKMKAAGLPHGRHS